jgi:hypothetical protein
MTSFDFDGPSETQIIDWNEANEYLNEKPDEDELVCLDQGQGDCAGVVEYREPLSATGQSFTRCDGHWAVRLEIQEGINQRYPQHAPSDFDPTYAGECWDEDY